MAEKAISFIMSVHLSICMEQLSSQWMDFREIWYEYISKICQES